MTRLDREARVTIKTLVSRGTTNTGVARLLGVTEGSVRYHVSRMVTGAIDGRGMKPFKAAPQAEAIEHWRQSQLDGALNIDAAPRHYPRSSPQVRAVPPQTGPIA